MRKNSGAWRKFSADPKFRETGFTRLNFVKFEIRISKSETIFKTRNIRIQNSSPKRFCLEHWDFLSFDIVSSFGSFDVAQDRFRASNLPFFLGALFDLAQDMLCVFARDVFQAMVGAQRGETHATGKGVLI
jgi:hypothetical protein